MKILLAVHHFPPTYTGGAEWEAFNTAKALQARGHHVQVLSVEKIDAGPTDRVAWEDAEYQGVPVRRLSFNVFPAPDRQRLEYDNTWIGDHLREWMQTMRPNVLHLMGGYLLSGRMVRVARELGVPAIVSLMDFWFLCRRMSMLRTDGALSTLPIDPVRCARCVGEERRAFRLLGQYASPLADLYWRSQTDRIQQLQDRLDFLRETLNQASALICRSNFVRQLFTEAGVSPNQMRFVRQGRDFPHLTPELIAKTASPTLRIGYLGQIAELKGVHVVLEAARQLPNANLSVNVYGNAEAFPTYTARLQTSIGTDQRLRLAGVYRSPAELAAILRELDVVIVPSIWYENSPNVIIEALAHHTPVIVSDLGGMAELVEEGVNGLRFAPGNASDLARVFQRLLNESELLPRLRAGIQPVKSLAQEMDELEAIYRAVTIPATTSPSTAPPAQ